MSTVQSILGGVVKTLVKTLPLPIKLPTELQRGRGAIGATELSGRQAFVTQAASSLDQAIAGELLGQGASLCCLDGGASEEQLEGLYQTRESGARMTRSAADLGDAGAFAEALDGLVDRPEKAAPPPGILIHRLCAPEHASELPAALEELYAIGHAAARALPKCSRVVFVYDARGGRTDPAAAMLRSSLGAYLRSLSKELGGRATTCHLIELEADSRDLDAARVAGFLCGPRASFLTGNVWRLTRAGLEWDPSRPSLEGKVVVITGAARGIGAAMAKVFAREGAAVGLNDLPSAESAASKLLSELRGGGARVAFLPFDVSTKDGAEGLAAAVEAEFGGVDVIVNNAGITRDRTIKRMTEKQWRQAVDVNLGAGLQVTAALDGLLRDDGAIVNLSSVMGIAGNFGQTNYCAAKGAVLGLTESLAVTLAERGVRVNAMAPGFIETRLTQAMPLMNREMAKQLTALLQPGQPIDVAELACFFAGPVGAALTGQVARVDGGMAVGA